MKKLMIAAAVAALAGVTFADCDTPVECAFAYRVKLAGKTVVGKAKTTGSQKTCDLDNACWAKPASLRIAGYVYGATTAGNPDECEGCQCNDFGTFEQVWWDATKTEQKLTFAKGLIEVLRSSGAQNKAQVLFTMDGLNLAGFANFNPKTQKIKNASGFFAGALAAPVCETCTEDAQTCTLDCQTTPAKVFAPCALDEAVASEAAIAFGRWTMTYKADKVAAYSKNGDVSVFKPTAFKAVE